MSVTQDEIAAAVRTLETLASQCLARARYCKEMSEKIGRDPRGASAMECTRQTRLAEQARDAIDTIREIVGPPSVGLG